MESTPSSFVFESMGTSWNVRIWDAVSDHEIQTLRQKIIEDSNIFDERYSRFIPSSLVCALSKQTGVVEVPQEFVDMLRLYEKLEKLSSGVFTPLVGFALSDLGYDEQYSLTPKPNVRPVPRFQEAIHIIDDTHIDLLQSTLIDIGALGKGYFVDSIALALQQRGCKHFLVDGSGDIFYSGNGEPIRCGLEHPDDSTKAIGVLSITHGGFCASGGNRRKWNNYHHIIHPKTMESPKDILATWVQAKNATLADALATCIYLCTPELFSKEIPFEWCVLDRNYVAHTSKGFAAELF